MKYPVNTLAEMAAIPDEAIPRFLEEVPALIAAQKAKQQLIDVGLVKDAGNVWWQDDGNKTVRAHLKSGDDIHD